MIIPNWYNQKKDFIQNAINSFLTKYFSNLSSEVLLEYKDVIFYSLKWWKKIRAILALILYLKFSWKKLEDLNLDDDIVKFCIAIECMHSYSLIHDDLPCMDNDEYRRWELTVWKKFWEYNWVLAWDLLNSLTFEILSSLKSKNALQIINIVSNSVWIYWMIWWQLEDMFFEENISMLNQEKLSSLHNKKTWELIKSAFLWWIILSGQNIDLQKWQDFALNFWLCFQIKDDILDVEWTFLSTWKSVWWEKKWFVYVYWLEKSKEILNTLTNNNKNFIKDLDFEELNFLVDYVSNREK